MASARFRSEPDFLVIGAKRGGTTSLYFHLLRHPAVLPLFPSGRVPHKRSETKGLRFFDLRYSLGERWYRSHFPLEATRRVRELRGNGRSAAGEATPNYLSHPLAAARAAAALPTVKIVALLRDPVERCYSHYREQRRNGVEALAFEDALDAEPGRVAGEEERLRRDPSYVSFALQHQAYVGQSEYDIGLARWLDVFPRDQVLVDTSERYYARPEVVIARIADFLGLPRAEVSAPTAMNAAPGRPLDPATRRRLDEHFAPHNAALEAMLGQTFRWSA
jgi:hypothetical protein